jgi:pilus assembly protein Flp/PilA
MLMPRQFVASLSPDRLLRCHWQRFQRDEHAVTAVEYGVMAALISVAIIGAVNATGQAIKTTLYGQIVSALSSMTK